MQIPNPSRSTPTDRALRRRGIEAVIARYPHVTDQDLERIFDFFRRESSGLDRRTIAANRRIRPQYRQLCQDHQIHRLPLIDTVVVLLGAFVLIVGILYFVVAA